MSFEVYNFIVLDKADVQTTNSSCVNREVNILTDANIKTYYNTAKARMLLFSQRCYEVFLFSNLSKTICSSRIIL